MNKLNPEEDRTNSFNEISFYFHHSQVLLLGIQVAPYPRCRWNPDSKHYGIQVSFLYLSSTVINSEICFSVKKIIERIIEN